MVDLGQAVFNAKNITDAIKGAITLRPSQSGRRDRSIRERQLVAVAPAGMDVVDFHQAADAEDRALVEAVPGVVAWYENNC